MQVKSLAGDDGGLSEMESATVLYCINPNCNFQRIFDFDDERDYDECPRCGSLLERDNEILGDGGLDLVDPETAYYAMDDEW